MTRAGGGKGENASGPASGSAMGMKQVLMTTRTDAGNMDRRRGHAGPEQTTGDRLPQVHVGPGTAGPDGPRETGGHLLADLETARPDGRTQNRPEQTRTLEPFHRGLHHPGHDAPPAGVHQSHPVPGSGEDNRDTVGGAYGEEESGNPCYRPVGVRHRAGSIGHRDRPAMNLPEADGGGGAGGRGIGSETAAPESALGQAGERPEPQDVGAVFEMPGPIHGQPG